MSFWRGRFFVPAGLPQLSSSAPSSNTKPERRCAWRGGFCECWNDEATTGDVLHIRLGRTTGTHSSSEESDEQHSADPWIEAVGRAPPLSAGGCDWLVAPDVEAISSAEGANPVSACTEKSSICNSTELSPVDKSPAARVIEDGDFAQEWTSADEVVDGDAPMFCIISELEPACWASTGNHKNYTSRVNCFEKAAPEHCTATYTSSSSDPNKSGYFSGTRTAVMTCCSDWKADWEQPVFLSEAWTAAPSKHETTLWYLIYTFQVCAVVIHPRRGWFFLNRIENQGLNCTHDWTANTVKYFQLACQFEWQSRFALSHLKNTESFCQIQIRPQNEILVRRRTNRRFRPFLTEIAMTHNKISNAQDRVLL